MAIFRTTMKLFNKSRLSYKIFITLSGVLFSLFFFGTWIFYILIQNILNERLEEQKQTALDLSVFKEVFLNIVEGISITDARCNRP